MHNFYHLRRVGILQFFLLCFFSPMMFAQPGNGNPCNSSSTYLYWTGEESNDFFHERNWRVTNEKPTKQEGGTGKPTCLPGANSFPYSICPNEPDLAKDKYPKAGTLEPGMPIRYNLYIENGDVVANGSIVFACAEKGMTILHSQLNITQGTISKGVVSLLDESTVHVREGDFSPQLFVNFLDTASWVYMHQQNPVEMMPMLSNILIHHVAGVLDSNFRINQYYQRGSLIRPASTSFTVLKIFNAAAQQGASADLKEDLIYSAAAIPAGMDNATRSFILKRGYMASFANNANGTGKSKVYIASEADLTIDALDVALQGNVSFIRVVPWNWVIKKGTGGFYDQLNTGWYYNWGLGSNPLPNYEYVPMAWGAGGASPASIVQMIQKKKTTHVLGFNESDNCEDQSGQFNNLCQPAVAVAYYENLMGLGVRLGTPAPRENGPTTWLLEFARIAKERDVRFDFVAVHWYDWGSNPANSPNADPQQIFNRFKAYLENVHRIYQLPIWITEFNANPNRGNAIQDAFLRLALPYLETLDYVERYAYFQPNPAFAQVPQTPANYYDTNGALTNIGELYMNHPSTPSIPEATVECANNLEGLDQPVVSIPTNSLVFEAECGKFLGNQWNILENAGASNGLYIRGNNSLAGATLLAKQVHFEFELTDAGSYRVWIRSSSTGGAGAIRIRMDGKEVEQISPFTSGMFTWFQIPRFYDLGKGKHRLTLEFPNSNILLDQVALTNGPETFAGSTNEAGYCTPDALKWGLEATDVIHFYEAELAEKGIHWNTETSVNSIGGSFLASEGTVVSTEVPEGTDKLMSFTVNVDKADEYDIWAKIQSMNPSASSLWIAVDNEPFRQWSNLSNATYEWYWKKFHFSYGTEERALTHFLSAGEHQIKIAIASGEVFVDRIAVATKGKLPEATDPNVLAISESLEFEAEEATLLGAATIVNCATSSNGKQVNLLSSNSNIVRFAEIVAESAGAYKMKVSYMSAALRTFRVVVNGVILGRQNPPISGAWCFNAGSPAVFEVTVILKRGINVIDITPFSGDAPFIDKIKLEKAALNGLTLEAETAELAGTNVTVACATASNLALINMGLTAGNAIRFNHLLATESKSYLVDIHYITKADRSLRISVNGEPFTTESFTASGNWCFEGGTTKVKTVELDLSQGSNSIEFRPTGADAPFIDRIVIREVEPVVTAAANRQEMAGANLNNRQIEKPSISAVAIYPNPVQVGTPVTLLLPDDFFAEGPALLQITDVTGRVVFAQTLPVQTNRQVKLMTNLSKGMYVLSVSSGGLRTSKKLIVQ
jgi:hypothetical protein